MDAIFLIATFVFFVTFCIYGLLAYLVWHKRSKSEQDWVFLATMAACGYWCLSNAIVSSFGTVLEEPSNTLNMILFQTSYPVLYLVPSLIRHCLVLSRLSLEGWRRWGHLALNYVGIPLVLYHLYASPRPLPEHYGPAFSGLLFLYLPLTIIEVKKRAGLRTRYALKPGARLIVYLGLGGVLVMCGLSSFFCYLYPDHAPFISLIPKLSPLPPALAIGYSVLRYRFMDMVLTRSLLYSALGGLFLCFSLLIAYYGGAWFFPDQQFRPVAFAVRFLILLFAFHFLFHALRDGLQKSIERSFFRHRLRSAEMLKRFTQMLTSWSDLDGLCRDSVEKITSSLGLTSATILFVDGTVYTHAAAAKIQPAALIPTLLQTNDPIVVIEELPNSPLKTACTDAQIGVIITLPCREQRGWLVLGEKHSGRPFFSQELSLLEAACGQLAMAIDNLLLVRSKLALEREMQHREKLAAIGQLAATVAHEIRNPITGAKCLLQQVGDELTDNTPGKEYVHLALEDLDRVEQSVSQLLSYARKEEFQFSEQDVNELLRATIQRFSTQPSEKKVTVSFQEQSSIWAAIDEEKMRRTLLNLLTNARDAVNGDGAITVNLTSTGPDVQIHVSDNGQGLSPEDQSRIFEPFFTTKEKGTGLGLAIAKKIVEGHGGQITVASTLGKGTTFTLTIPRQRPETRSAA
jgi:signal transduction histidine kinase